MSVTHDRFTKRFRNALIMDFHFQPVIMMCAKHFFLFQRFVFSICCRLNMPNTFAAILAEVESFSVTVLRLSCSDLRVRILHHSKMSRTPHYFMGGITTRSSNMGICGFGVTSNTDTSIFSMAKSKTSRVDRVTCVYRRLVDRFFFSDDR